MTEELTRSDVDAEMTVLTPEDVAEENLDATDEVEDLRNSLREVVRDENVQPKMQCLMMDSSFSMVTMQGEDSGIAWETTPSRASTPWASEAGYPTVDMTSPIPAQHGSAPAGKIIFVMDEGLMSRRKKAKDRVSRQKKPQERLAQSLDNISGRPELVEVSEPNMTAQEGTRAKQTEHPVDKEKRLFSLVSEGSEILNIVVPPRLASVDEEESKKMEDNLSYLVENPVPKAREEINDNEFVFLNSPETAEQIQTSLPMAAYGMDPPGAPVAVPPGKEPSGIMDYFDAFTLIEAPGSPAVITEGQVETETEDTPESQDAEKQVKSKGTKATTAVDKDGSDTVGLQEITSELLDEVFYGGTEDYLAASADRLLKDRGTPMRPPSKPSGSTLFGSQEDILTPIFLPEGPPKIIDPILLEEPKAMAFLYTDLYEEAIGSRKKEEDTESMTSEKSFHSRQSDREARGYLEKYALIDETPAVEVQPSEKEKCPEEGPRTLSQDLYDFSFLSKPEKGEVPNSEEEITDFFRSSGNSSPCDLEPFPRSLEDDDTEVKTKAKTNKSVTIKEAKVSEVPVDPISISCFEIPLEEYEWESSDDPPTTADETDFYRQVDHQEEMHKPVAPPRKKTATSPKTSLDLAPLTPVDMITQEQEGVGGNEQSEEERGTALVAETVGGEDWGCFSILDADQTGATRTESDTNPSAAEKSDTAAREAESGDVNIKSPETDETENQDESTAAPTEPAKEKGRCIIQ